MRGKKVVFLLALLFAGWGPDTGRSSRVKKRLVLRKDNIHVTLLTDSIRFRAAAPGIPMAEVCQVAYSRLEFDPYNPSVLINLPPFGRCLDLDNPGRGLFKPEVSPYRDTLMQMHELLCELMTAVKGPPAKTTLVEFLRSRLDISRERIRRLLSEGTGEYWLVRAGRPKRFSGVSMLYYPVYRRK